uniref:Uncharacterized protein n=1 Tax=Kryptolebias marmoratus TaxID=37003 RepID=A0A3Q2ZJ33_KRYMA
MEIMEIINLGADLLQTTIGISEAMSKLSPHRQCIIHIINLTKCYVLQNPRIYLCRGRCVDPPPPIILPSSSGSAAFAKTPRTGRGFFGVFKYDLLNRSTQKATEQVAVLFRVPHNIRLKANEFAVGVFDISRECNSHLYTEMSTKVDTTFIKGQAKGPSLTHTGQNVTIRATMSDCSAPVIKVHMSNRDEM